jgi:PTH1 family peptidyl-tRNA hydrolase
MRLIVGLGNPGPKYLANRHNIGFLMVDALADILSAPSFQKKFNGQFSKLKIGDDEIGLLKPQTFMNLSGDSVQQAMQFFKIQLENVWVIHDDIDLAVGKLRIKKGGGAGGHNGLKDIDARLGADYWRLRIGVGRPDGQRPAADYVLDDFDANDQDWLTALQKELPNHLGDMIAGNTNQIVPKLQEVIAKHLPKVEEAEEK